MKKPPPSLWTEIAQTRIREAYGSGGPSAQEGTGDTRSGVASPRIGDSFVKSGRLSEDDVKAIIEKQRTEKLRFGDAAIALGLLSEQEVQQALSKQYDYPIASADAALAGFPIAYAPHTPEAEAIRKIRTQLLLKLEPSELRCLAIVSPNSGEGKSYVSTSLALAFAQNGQRTLLINANLREAQHSGVLDSQRSQGLSSVLSQRGDIEQSMLATSFAKLHLLDAGPLPPNPTELLLAPSLLHIFENIKDQFDIVIMDTPAMNAFPDAQLIAQQVDACIVVARQHRTPLNDLRKTKRLIQAAGGAIIGCIFNEYPDLDGPGNPTPWYMSFLHKIRRRLIDRIR